ncbi:MAG: hypothetical protein AAGD96_08515, partial [Chloroflexota bacterium]
MRKHTIIILSFVLFVYVLLSITGCMSQTILTEEAYLCVDGNAVGFGRDMRVVDEFGFDKAVAHSSDPITFMVDEEVFGRTLCTIFGQYRLRHTAGNRQQYVDKKDKGQNYDCVFSHDGSFLDYYF